MYLAQERIKIIQVGLFLPEEYIMGENPRNDLDIKNCCIHKNMRRKGSNERERENGLSFILSHVLYTTNSLQEAVKS